MLVLGPRIIHHISPGRSSVADSREAVHTLRSCMLVCRPWAPVARRYLQDAVSSRIWSLVVRQVESTGERRALSVPAAVYPFLHAARSMLRHPLLKIPLGIFFASITSVELGSWDPDSVACSVDGLCRAITCLESLQRLELVYLAWADSGLEYIYSHLPVTSHTRTRLHEIHIYGELDWLEDIRSTHFITWMARSGTASELMAIHCERMMIFEEPLLAALAAVIDASRGSLRELYLGVGPDLDTWSRKFPY